MGGFNNTAYTRISSALLQALFSAIEEQTIEQMQSEHPGRYVRNWRGAPGRRDATSKMCPAWEARLLIYPLYRWVKEGGASPPSKKSWRQSRCSTNI